MLRIPENYLERVYAGWLGKVIGIRLGAPIESWTYEKIERIYGDLRHYAVNYHEFAADDDSNGPLFFLRALLQVKPGEELTAQHVGEALLNYAPFEHGFFWWGGYGVSTEHTAYLNLRSGIKAPQSGSAAQNGAAIAEQIGGQIFIDTWGLVAPGNPDLAAKLARQAASVTHDGNGVYGGIFVAVCVSLAFVEREISQMIERALQYIPSDCEYARAVRAVMAYHERQPNHWRECFHYVHENFGYDRYPGNCHIIPNISVMILALLYGAGNFDDTLNICNMCGWDTDCNVGNVGAIMGTLCGIEGIDCEKWAKPIGDLLICSSVIGSLNIMDLPYGASFIAMLAYRLAGEAPPPLWQEIFQNRIDSCHFEYPASTHAMRVRTDEGAAQTLEFSLANSTEAAFTGARSLKLTAMPLEVGQKVYLYKKTYYQPKDFHDSRYDPCFSPILYPGQTVEGSVLVPEFSYPCSARLYVRELRTGKVLAGEPILVKQGEWATLRYTIPRLEGTLLGEAGFLFEMLGGDAWRIDFVAYVDDLIFSGTPRYTLDFAKEEQECWPGLHREISQMTRLKGIQYLEGGALHLSCADYAEAYTGRYDWRDYTAVFDITPLTGTHHRVNVRVQGAIRSYTFGFEGQGRLALLKNQNGYCVLCERAFAWRCNQRYHMEVTVRDNVIAARCDGVELLFTDEHEPYLEGSIGLAVCGGSHLQCERVELR
ncbi:MAG: ADP-ribosylglycohydrolase family protein [Clostridia bacterium]